jgi:hypothetical protein
MKPLKVIERAYVDEEGCAQCTSIGNVMEHH